MTKNYRLSGAFILALSLTACATPPALIDPVKTASTKPCLESDRKYLKYLIEDQAAMAREDAIGVILIGLPINTLGRGDHSKEIAELKGRCGN